MSLPSIDIGLQLDNSYEQLGPNFSQNALPSPAPRPSLMVCNEKLAAELGLTISGADVLSCFSGNALPLGASPIAQVYAGHQFGHFNPQLGDGRALLLGELIRPDGGRVDIQLKGAGLTPFSRGGDGRAALGPVLREYLMSEAMYALGVPTTRALSAVATGSYVIRDKELPGAVLSRVASSHIRIGTFEFFARRGKTEQVKKLADYVIQRHYPDCNSAPNPYLALFDQIAEAQARLVAHWQSIGFVHGVMNTDNTSICAETIDYGPCAFVDTFTQHASFSSIDTAGRYAYGQQGSIIQWNLARLAECLLRLMDEDIERAVALAEQRLGLFPQVFEGCWITFMSAKLGFGADFSVAQRAKVKLLVDDLLVLMEQGAVDFTLSFRLLGRGLLNGDLTPFKVLFSEVGDGALAWLERWRALLGSDGRLTDKERGRAMLKVNPSIIPRNHLVERALAEALENYDCAADTQNFPYFSEMDQALKDPYSTLYDDSYLAMPPGNGGGGYKTFCGT